MSTGFVGDAPACATTITELLEQDSCPGIRLSISANSTFNSIFYLRLVLNVPIIIKVFISENRLLKYSFVFRRLHFCSVGNFVERSITEYFGYCWNTHSMQTKINTLPSNDMLDAFSVLNCNSVFAA